MGEFVDTNVFIRLLAQDDPVKTQRCLALFQRASRGEVQLFTSEAIVAEVVYVLSSPKLYRLPRAEITRLLRPVLMVGGLRVEHKRALLEALGLYEQTTLDFEDCLAVKHVQRARLDGMYSYDRGFDRVTAIRRLEP